MLYICIIFNLYSQKVRLGFSPKFPLFYYSFPHSLISLSYLPHHFLVYQATLLLSYPIHDYKIHIFFPLPLTNIYSPLSRFHTVSLKLWYLYHFCICVFWLIVIFYSSDDWLSSRLWGWSGVGHAVTSMATPPESPHAALMRDTSLQYEDAIIPELDIYAIPSKEGTFLKINEYFGCF